MRHSGLYAARPSASIAGRGLGARAGWFGPGRVECLSVPERTGVGGVDAERLVPGLPGAAVVAELGMGGSERVPGLRRALTFLDRPLERLPGAGRVVLRPEVEDPQVVERGPVVKSG